MSNRKQKPISEFLEEQFNEMAEGTAAPSELQSEVFNTLDTLTLIGDVAGLFTINFTMSEAIVIDAAMKRLENDIENQ